MYQSAIIMNTIAINKKSTSLRLTEELYTRIQTLAKKENRSINNFIETILFEAVGYDEPNAATKKNIETSLAEEKNLKKYSSAKALFEDLENEL